MKSAKELKGKETISQGNELIDCKDGTSARPPGLRAPLYMEDRVGDLRDGGHMSNHSHSHQLCLPACFPIMPLWLQNCEPLFGFHCIFIPRVPLDSY